MALLLRRLSRRQVAAVPPSHQLITKLPTLSLDLNQRLPCPAHLAWLLDALSALLSTYSSLYSALSSSSATLPAPAPQEALSQLTSQSLPLQKHLQQRADEIVCLLDASNALQQVADHLSRQVGRLDHALQGIEEVLQLSPSSSSLLRSSSFSSSSSLSSFSTSSTAHEDNIQRSSSGWRLRRAARRLSACLQNQSIENAELSKAVEAASILLLSARNRLKSLAPRGMATEQMGDSRLMSQAMHETALTTLLILAAALSALAPGSKTSNRIISRSCRFMKWGTVKKSSLWAATLKQLQQSLLQAEKSSTGVVFNELQELHTSAGTLLVGMENLEDAIATEERPAVVEVKRMRKTAQALQESLLELGGDMRRLFQTLLGLRVALLAAAPAVGC